MNGLNKVECLFRKADKVNLNEKKWNQFKFYNWIDDLRKSFKWIVFVWQIQLKPIVSLVAKRHFRSYSLDTNCSNKLQIESDQKREEEAKKEEEKENEEKKEERATTTFMLI